MKNRLTIKDLPDSEKPYEKFLNYGSQSLSDAELLAIIIKSGTNGLKSVEVAQNLLNQKNRNLMNLYDVSFEEMLKLKGIGKVKAIQLKCIAELSNRITATKYASLISLCDAKSRAAYYMEKLRHECQELLILCMFDSKCKLIADSVISKGSVNSSIVPPREIFMEALKKQAVHIVLLHNHPSGNSTPSKEDDEVTERIAGCGQMIGIPLSDHIIIGDQNYYSYRESGLL